MLNDKKRILITGATGFVGAHLANEYINHGYEVISIAHDNHPISTSKILNVHNKIVWCNGNITDFELLRRVIADYDISEIIHAAAMSIERGGFRTTQPYFSTNVMGTVNILDAMKEQVNNGFDIKLLHFSTDKIYGDIGNNAYNETSIGIPNSIYSCSKACADMIVQTYMSTFDLPISIVRSANIYGFGDLNSRVIPNTIDSCLKNKRPIIYHDLNSIREYIYIDDVCNALKIVLDNFSHTKGQVYNIGSGELYSQDECVFEILKHFFSISPFFVPSPNYAKKELPYQKMNSSKIKDELNWESQISFEEGVEITIKKTKNEMEQRIS